MLTNRARVRDYIDTLPPTGATGSFLIAHQGTVILNHSVGAANRATATPNTDQTLFDIGSIAKAITAIGIFQLQAAGRLHFSDPITRYLPAVPADKQSITIHHLLTHSAGLEQYHTEGDFDPMTRDEAVMVSLAAPLRWTPGEREGYSNAGYAVLGALIEIIAGESYQTYIRGHLLEPLGMASTGWFSDPALPAARIAHGYVDGEDQGTPADWPITWALLGGGGMVSTITDLYRLHQALQGDQLLSTEAKQIMYTPLVKKWASGWEVLPTPYGLYISKGGASDLGFTSQLGNYVDQQVTLILLLNSFATEHGNNTHNHVQAELARHLFAPA